MNTPHHSALRDGFPLRLRTLRYLAIVGVIATGWSIPQMAAAAKCVSGQHYDASTTCTVPLGVTSIDVKAWGAGGSAGPWGNGSAARGGGGGGSFCGGTISVTPGEQLAVTVGVGGVVTSDTVAQDGGQSGVAAVVALGGTKGDFAAGGSGGAACSGVGLTGYAGGTGGARSGTTTTGTGGGGGGSATATASGGNGTDGVIGTPGAGGTGEGAGGAGGPAGSAGNNGIVPGGGGGGAGNDASGAYATRGRGANGRVILTFTAPATTSFTSTVGTDALTFVVPGDAGTPVDFGGEESCGILAGVHRYAAQSFTATDSVNTIISSTNVTGFDGSANGGLGGEEDNFVALYEGVFDPQNPTVGLVGCNDDKDGDNNNYKAEFEASLVSGQKYTAVFTAYSNVDPEDDPTNDRTTGSMTVETLPPVGLIYTVGGTVSGLGSGKSVGLRLSVGATATDVTISANGSFTFNADLANTNAYTVSIPTLPVGQGCTLSNGSGTISAGNVINVGVACGDIGVPDAPVIDALTPGNRQISVAFTPGSDNFGGTSTYTATCTSSDGGASGTASGAESPLVVSGLTNDKTYTCTVKATNSIGDSAESGASDSGSPFAAWSVSLLAGDAENGNSGYVDGTGSDARFSYPFGVAADRSGNAYVADNNNHCIRKISPVGAVTTLAGLCEEDGTQDGTGEDARFYYPAGIAADSTGNNIYVADTDNHCVRKVTSEGVVTTLAGTCGSSGQANGTGPAARFNYPYGVAVDGSGNVFVADSSNACIRKITTIGVVTTLAGTCGDGNTTGSDDGSGASAKFDNPYGIAVDAEGSLFVADRNNYAIRKITTAGVVTTLVSGLDDRPHYLALDDKGNLFMTSRNYAIDKIDPGGAVSRIAGSGDGDAFIPGLGTDADFSYPMGIAFVTPGLFYVVDSGANLVAKLELPAVEPDAPTSVTGVPGDAEVTVSWTAPVSNGGAAITSYTVTGSPTGTCTATAPATSCLVSGLTNDIAHTFTVTATNSAGTSEASLPSAAVTPSAASGQENEVPNPDGSGTGDGNGDGIPDSQQPHVASLRTAVGDSFATIVSLSNRPLVSISAAPRPSDLPGGINTPYGAFSFTATNVTPGATEAFELWIPYNATIRTALKKNRLSGKWANVATKVDQVGNKTRITFSLKDGGPYDADGLANGVITDPIAPADADVSDTVAPIPTLSQWGMIILSSLLGLGTLLTLRRRTI